MSIPGTVDIGGISVPLEVVQKAQSYAHNKNTEIGLWEADNPNHGIMGFILIPTKYKTTDPKRSLIKGYVAPLGSSPEQIPDPLYEVKPDEEGMEIWPQESKRERGYATVDRIESPQLDLTGYAASAKFMMKKSEWLEIGKKAGWIKTASIIKNKEKESENYKQALPIAAVLPYAIPLVLSAAPSIIQMFSGDKAAAEEHVEEAMKNPGMMQQQMQQASGAKARIEKIISNLSGYAAKLGLPCANMTPPTKCSGQQINDTNVINKKMQELENAYKNLSTNKNGNPCELLKQAHDLNICAKNVIELNSLISNELYNMQQGSYFDTSSFGA